VALFTDPASALHAAFAAVRVAMTVSLQVHVGLHYGSVLREAGAAFGSTVNLVARICSVSSADEVLVSSELREALTLTDADDIEFIDRGRQRLKGVRAPQQLFAAVATN
jgi:class 3 adenylate cyclase